MTMGRMFFGLALLLASFSAAANEWRVQAFADDPNDVVMPALLDAFRFHAEPASAWYLDQLNGRYVPYDKFMVFHREISRATYAAFEYTYTQDGRRRTRIYYAMSGRNDPLTGLATPASHLASYIVEDSTRVHAYASTFDRSTLRATQLEDEQSSAQHARDAEFKALRSIERDIQQRVVTRGGSITAFISQPMCDSCEHVMHQFSEIYGVDISVNYLEGGMSQAYYRFRGAVQGFMNTLLVRARGNDKPGPTPPPPAAGMCARIFAE